MSLSRIYVSGTIYYPFQKISVQKFAKILSYVIMIISDENRSDSPFVFDAFPGVPAPGNFIFVVYLS